MGQLNEASRKENNMKASQNFEATSSFAEPKTVEMKKQLDFKIWLFFQEGLVAQRITRLPTEQKIAGSNPV